MKQPLLKYGLSLWLTACLLTGISVWSGQAHAQTRKIDKVLQTLGLKKKESSTKPTRKPKGNRGSADVTEAGEPLMERRTPQAGKQIPNKNRINKPTRQPSGKHGRSKSVIDPSEEPRMELRKPGVGQPLPKNNKHRQPELNGNKTLGIRQRNPQKQQKIYQGERKVKKSQIHEPGTHYSERKETVGQQYNSYQTGDFPGNQKVKKSSISRPGTHYSERKAGAGMDAQGPSYSGDQKVKKSSISQPGKGLEKSQRDIDRHQRQAGTGFMGFFRKKKRDILVPGTHHKDRPASLSRQYTNSNQATSYGGSQRVRKNRIQEPGTHYSDRRETVGQQYSSYQAGDFSGHQKVKKSSISQPGTHYTDRKMGRSASRSNAAANYSGNKRVKKKYLKEPGTLHTERKSALAGQYSSSAATNFQGHLKGISKRERSRFYEKQSKKVHQYEGDIKLRFNKENMHPSHVARNAKRMRSAEQVDRYRSFSKWWARLWQKEQPEVVKKKPAKPRYDKKEKDIWEDSRNW